MRSLIKIFLTLAVVLGMGLTGAQAQTVSNCTRALGEQFLDVNNVRARILNTGGLFYRGEPHVYEVPKGSGSNAIFASGIWIAGQVNGQLRAAATRYGEWEFWAGPLDENGNPPVDCSVYDRVYKVSKTDIDRYDQTGQDTPDLRDWPTGLGAPTLDANGEVIPFDINVPLAQRGSRTVDLAAGERPAIIGDQSIWWVMNDRGNTHGSTGAPPLGLEVHGLAFAFNLDGDVGNMTFYKYNMFYKGASPLTDTYLGIFSDPDLGDFADDYVGSDTTLGLGYVYNSDNEDISGEGYGTPPPAAGYDFFQGPIVPSVGDTALVSGRKVPDFKNLDMTAFVYYNNGGGVNEDPVTGEDYYNYMQGRWKDGRAITFGGDGFESNTTTTPTKFMYPGDPESGEGWSEVNPAADGSVPPNTPADRRFALATGPFTINPGDQQEIVFGVVFAKGTDNLNSVTELKRADGLAQQAFDVNFVLPVPPQAPQVTATELDGTIILEWENAATSNNFLEAYVEFDPFALDPNAELIDRSYEFQAYEVIQYSDVADLTGTVIATYDIPDGVTRVVDGLPEDIQSVVFNGGDNGVQTFHRLTNLTNYKNYYFGVRAIAYNELSLPKIYRSPTTRIEVVPSRTEDVLSEAAVEAQASTAEPDIIADRVGLGEGRVLIDVVNASRVKGDSYSVEFYEMEVGGKASFKAEEEKDPSELEVDEMLNDVATANKGADEHLAITYDIKRGSTVVFDGRATGEPAPQRANVIVIDGLQFSVLGPQPGIKGFAATTNAAGPIDPWDMGAYAFNSNGFPMLEANGITPEGSQPSADRPTRGVQQSTSDAVWGVNVGGGDGTFDGAGSSYMERSIRGRGRTVVGSLGSNDFEIRFSQRCADTPDACIGWRRFEDDLPMNVPFEIWNLGTTPGPEDDYRMIPAILDNGGEVWHLSTPGVDTMYTNIDLFDVGGDHPVSGGTDDAYTDWVYWFNPADTSPGEAGYEAFAAAPTNDSPDLGGEILARQVYVNWNGWQDADDDGVFDSILAELPETGTVIKIITFKPSAPGDVHTFSTANLATRAMSIDEKVADLDNIGIVPNPYKGASAYERSQLTDQVRFTNMPDQATIRIFTLNGTLIRTIEKNSTERFITWNLTTENDLPIASGMYLVHVDVPNVGNKVIKFGVVKRRIQLGVF